MKLTRWMGWGVGLAVLVGACLSARADVYLPKDLAHSATHPIQSAEDAVASVPGLSKIPRSFLIGDGFKFKLSGQELRIDHMATHSRAPVSHRNCMISMDLASPVAFFGSSMEIPLFNGPNLSSWGVSSLGDYVLHFAKDTAVAHPTAGLKISARF